MKLHIGCGKSYIPGFIHIDKDSYDHIDYNQSFESLPFVDTGVVDLIYCSHAIQYFDHIEIIPILKEWRRVLKSTGILRCAVPDFKILIEIYKSYNVKKIIGPLFGRIQIKQGDKSQWIYHKTTYDFELLQSTLLGAGFSKIYRYDWKKTLHKDYDDCSQAYIPHMDKENGVLISLNVEALP